MTLRRWCLVDFTPVIWPQKRVRVKQIMVNLSTREFSQKHRTLIDGLDEWAKRISSISLGGTREAAAFTLGLKPPYMHCWPLRLYFAMSAEGYRLGGSMAVVTCMNLTAKKFTELSERMIIYPRK